jgi:threonine dehydrogenase-like Zn-dependent dehydrogenase
MNQPPQAESGIGQRDQKWDQAELSRYFVSLDERIIGVFGRECVHLREHKTGDDEQKTGKRHRCAENCNHRILVVIGHRGMLLPRPVEITWPSTHFRRSSSILRKGGTMVAYGLSDSLRNGKPDRWVATKAFVGGILLPKLVPNGKRTVFYSAFDLEKSQPRAYAEDLGKVLRLLAAGRIDPLVMRSFPLEQAKEAEALLESGKVTGTLVLECGPA